MLTDNSFLCNDLSNKELDFVLSGQWYVISRDDGVYRKGVEAFDEIKGIAANEQFKDSMLSNFYK